MNEKFLSQIKERREKLENVKIALKEKFIGIDDVIDKIIDNISLWYLTPEIQFRPLIISLWGITGVGKTDLVRTLVKLLDFTDRFIEIQMDTQHEYSRTIESYLDSSGVDASEPSILLLDEIQRYRTIDETGSLVDNKYFNDIWMLLSDGKLQSNSKRRAEALEMLHEEMYWNDQRNEEDEDEDKDSDIPVSDETRQSPLKEKKKKKKKDYRFKTNYWSAIRFKKLLDLKLPTDEIMEKTPEERVKMLEEFLKGNNINEGKSYEKLLIFISGNLDEAFHMAEEVEDSESDADVYYALSKRITILHIKEALLKKFKPEQIARFGNNHVIYPCLDKKSYYKIIQMNCYKILDRVEKEHKIKITLSEEVFKVIYRNGVFPTQGVRPAISTVFNVLGSNLPHFIYHAFYNGVKKFHLDIDKKNLTSKIKGKIYKKKLILDIDYIKESRTIDEKMLITVHEIGHALVYAIFFKTPPKQISVNSASVFNNGFIITHIAVNNKTFLKNQIAVFLAGQVAEELVFGDNFKSSAAAADIANATNMAGLFVRSYGMDGNITKIVKPFNQLNSEFNYNIDESNKIMETLLIDEKKNAKELIQKNMTLFKRLIDFTIKQNRITGEEFVNICKKNKLKLSIKEMSEKLIYSYDEKVSEFLNN